MKTGMQPLFCWLLAGWVIVCARAEPLTVATYNVENYTVADRMAEGVYRKEYPKPESDKDALRAVILQINADMLVLQEMGGEPYLRELQRDLKREALDYPHATVMMADDKDRMTAVLSKRPFARVTRHDDLVFKHLDTLTKVRRGLLEVRVATERGEVAFFAVHLKSRYTESADDPQAAGQRAGEAVAIRDRVLQIFPEPAEARFMILGDFNDGHASRPVRAMLERGDTVISEWLPAADTRGHVWTHFFRKGDSYSRVDHILVSPGLLPQVKDATGRIHDSPEVARASDHRPVVAVIE